MRRWPVALCLVLIASGCASVEPRREQAERPSGVSVVLAGWPTETTVRALEDRLEQLDAFGRLLLGAGLEDRGHWPPRDRPLDRNDATRLLTYLLNRPLPLRSYPQRMGVCFLLREVLQGGEVSRDELNRRVDRFRMVAVLRPDGYLAWVLSGRTQQRAGPGQVEFKNGVFQSNGFVLGRFYSGLHWAYRPMDEQLRTIKDSDILGEVHDDVDLFGRAMDGAEEAFFALAMAIGKILSRPMESIAGLRHLPTGVAALIASSPEYLERFELMTAGEQIQAVSRLATTLITMFAGGGAVSSGVTRGVGGMEVASLSLSAQGTLALGRVVVPAGEVTTVLASGAGAAIILQNTATLNKSADPPQTDQAQQGTDDLLDLGAMLREAASRKGDFGIGSATRAQAEAAGRAWVGPRARLSRDGRALVSEDGLRIYRPPKFKPDLGKMQANFQQKASPGGQPISNAHLDIIDP